MIIATLPTYQATDDALAKTSDVEEIRDQQYEMQMNYLVFIVRIFHVCAEQQSVVKQRTLTTSNCITSRNAIYQFVLRNTKCYEILKVLLI